MKAIKQLTKKDINMFGSWKVNVAVGMMPEAVATAFAKCTQNLIGATYKPIAYLGSQIVNGINHAVLAEQTISDSSKDKNIVLMVFNEKPVEGAPSEITLSKENITSVLDGNAVPGGTFVDAKTDIPVEAMEALNDVLALGAKVEAFALLGTQVTVGTNYFFAAEVTPATRFPQKKVALVSANNMLKTISFKDII